MIYTSRDEARTAWANAAAAKLRADDVDSNDLKAVERALLATVGSRRLFECWLAVHGPQEGEKTCQQP